MVIYIVEILVTDNGGNQQTATATITVNNTNDNAPAFEETSYYGEVKENEGGVTIKAVGTDTVLTLRATEPDADGTTITYSIGSSYANALLEKETLSSDNNITFYSILRTSTHGLDRETDPKLQFQVYADDSGSHRATATVVITTIGVNDNNPIFQSQIFSFDVADDAVAPTTIGNVVAIDKDIPNDGIVHS